MITVAQTSGDNQVSAFSLNGPYHFLSFIAMFANDKVYMIRHDRTGIAGVISLINDLPDCVGDGCELHFRECQSRELQRIVGPIVELANNRARRLDFPSAVMQFAEFRDTWIGDRFGSAAAWVIREPATVGGPDEVMRDDGRTGHSTVSRVCC